MALNQAFGYDELGRLTSVATSPGTWTIGYDANGNRTAMTWAKAAAAPVTRVYGVAPTSNRLLGLSTPARTMGHDAAGNVLSDWQGFVGFAATYDLAGRLALMESSTNGSNYETTQYWYDAHGQRVLKYPTGATRCSGNPRSCVAQTVTKPTVYVYGPDGQLMGEYDGQTGAVRREYVWLQGAPVAFVDGTTSQNTTYYVQTDHLDTPRVVLDRQGRQRWSWVSEPFGTGAPATNPLGFGAVTLNLRMPGQYFDKESGLSQNWFRDYDAGVGRYTQSDPIGLAGGINTYSYVENQPTMKVDPTGELAFLLPFVPAATGWGWGSAAVAAGAIFATASMPGDTSSSEKRTVPYPDRKRGKYTCICRANKDGRSPDNCSIDNQDSAMGYGEGPTLADAKRAAEKDAKEKLGARSTHHIQCRCTGPNGDRIIPHG